MDELIERLRQRIRFSPAIDAEAHAGSSNERGEIGPSRPRPALSPDEVDALEREFGFRFPTLVRRLYTEVADGNYGPCWGINRLRQPPQIPADPVYPAMMSIEAWFSLDLEEWEEGKPPEWWPHPHIRFCEVGCNIYIGVDCSIDEGPVIMYDPNLSQDDRECFVPVADTLAQWLSHWLDEKPWPAARYS